MPHQRKSGLREQPSVLLSRVRCASSFRRKQAEGVPVEKVIMRARPFLIPAAVHDEQPAVSPELQRFRNIAGPAAHCKWKPGHRAGRRIDRSTHHARSTAPPNCQDEVACEVDLLPGSAFKLVGVLAALVVRKLNVGLSAAGCDSHAVSAERRRFSRSVRGPADGHGRHQTSQYQWCFSQNCRAAAAVPYRSTM